MKRKKAVAAAVVLAVLAAGAGLVTGWNYLNNQDCAATVNGIEIPKEELRIFMDENRLEVMNYFRDTCRADINSEDFWSTDYNGEVPEKLLYERWINEAVRTKREQEEAVDA